MDFLKKLSSFWLVIILVGLVGYFSAHNLERIYVNIPQVGEFKMRAAIAFIFCFSAGAFMTVLYFGLDAFKKTLQIKRLKKQVIKLKKQLITTEKIAPTTPEPETVPETSVQTVENPA